MKRRKYLSGLFTFVCLLLANMVCAQGTEIHGPYQLEVTWDKTTVLVFPGNVLSIDRGHKALLAQKDDVAGNILKIKGGERHFPATNLHVVTDRGVLYQFEVRYSDYPYKTTHYIESADQHTLQFDFPHSKADFINCVNQIMGRKAKSKKTANKYKMGLSLLGIFQKDGVLYFQLGVENHSQIPFEIKELKAVVKDSKQVKRTSSREEAMEYRFSYFENGTDLNFGSPKVIVLAFPQFTIADKKHLHLLLSEKQGDRVISIKLKGKHLLKADSLSHVQL
ncbi:conjugative transposon protein TraN [Belliella sp. R4-6]|uniref:Conjugative transposon protein TraN n=1 Tax=Belliella alkalica TaxID=1730871 RepID=A0ABS9VFP8_9BACT|nr:DUF4138 domain-containing protein [Belliella alkalica]MCH7415271.1 conjugative transposon protein TraN [Belliella alkalica]